MTETWSPAEVRAWVERHGGNRSDLARLLGVHRTELQRWMSDADSAQPIPPRVQAHMATLDLLQERASEAYAERRGCG